jgi:hypothetical protein
METLEQVSRTHPPLPIPDSSLLSDYYSDWGVWIDPADPSQDEDFSEEELDLGLMLSEYGITIKRLLITGLIFALLGPGVMLLSYTSLETAPVFIGLGALFLGGGIYRLARLFINQNLRLRIFREGFSLRTWKETVVLSWKDIESIQETWWKMIIQGIFHIHIHRVNLSLVDGNKLVLDRRLKGLGEISWRIQNAITLTKFPEAVNQLSAGESLTFGPFKLNRFGLEHKGKKALPWKDLKQLNIQRHGETTVSIRKKDQGKLSFPWAGEKGSKVPNLNLFSLLANWFLIPHDLHQVAEEEGVVPPAEGRDMSPRTEYIYSLVLPKKAAMGETKRTLYVGRPKAERRLDLQIQPGEISGTKYRYPGYGPDDPVSGQPTTLMIEVLFEEKGRFQERLIETQITAGIVLILLGLMWLSFFSTLPYLTSILLAAAVGGIGGLLMSVQRRWLGLICGLIGGGVSLLLQVAYYIFNWVQFGRDRFWNYESVLILMISLLPGFGLYYWLFKRKPKSARSPKTENLG